MKNILVPTDFSAHSENALNVAVRIAQKADADITLLHVIPKMDPHRITQGFSKEVETIAFEYFREVEKSSLQKLDKLIANADLPAERITKQVEYGNIHKAILKQIDNSAIDLVVMGTQGTRPLEEMFVGSNTERIVRLATCPVLAVREKGNAFTSPKLLFPTDLRTIHPPAIEKLKEFQELLQAELHLVFVNMSFGFLSDKEIEERKAIFDQQVDLEPYTFHVVSAKSEETGILVTARNLDVDFIALITHQRKGLSHIFLGSTTEDVVNHSNRSVLTLGMSMA